MRKSICILVISMLTFCFTNCSKKQSTAPTKEQQDSIERVKKDSLQRLDSLKVVQKAKQDSIKAVAEQERKTVIAKLNKNFQYRKDEFEDRSWVYHNSSPKYTNVNAVYLYFQQNSDGSVENLRFRVQYESDDWLFIKKMIFNIDGANVEFFPNDMERDNNSRIWEWCDESADWNMDLVNKISRANSVKIKFVGDQYYDVKKMSQSHLVGFKETLSFYKALSKQ